jgi:hypothetical protein
LGAGKKGEPNDFDHLKAHPFFKGLNFQTVSTLKVPLSSAAFPKPEAVAMIEKKSSSSEIKEEP